MPQEFQVLQCYSCKTFQVHQVKKAKKWACKMCGEKQSVLKVYGVGTGAECRQHVQKLNTHRGEVESLKETLPCHESRPFPTDITVSNIDGPIHDGSGNKWSQFVEKSISQPDDTIYSDQDHESDRFTTDGSLLDKRKMSRKRKFQSYPVKAQKTTSSKYEDFLEDEEEGIDMFDRRALSYIGSNTNKHRQIKDDVTNDLRHERRSLSFEHSDTNTNIRGDVTNNFTNDRRNPSYMHGNKYRGDDKEDEETSNMTYDRVIKTQPVLSKSTKFQGANGDNINEKLPDKVNHVRSINGSNMQNSSQDTIGIITSSNTTVFPKKVNQTTDTSQSKWNMYTAVMEHSSQTSLEEEDILPLADTDLDTRRYVDLDRDVLEGSRESEKRNYNYDIAPKGQNHQLHDTSSSRWGKFLGMNDETDIFDVKDIPSTKLRKDDAKIRQCMVNNCNENEIPPPMPKNVFTSRNDKMSTKPHGVFPALTTNTNESADSNVNVLQNRLNIIQDSKCLNIKQHTYKQGGLNMHDVEGGGDSAQVPLKPVREKRDSECKPSTLSSALVQKPVQVASLFSVGEITDDDLEL